MCDGAGHDLWAVNADDEYLEESRAPRVQPYRRAPVTPTMRDALAEAQETA
jgi:hypothetical protein